ncbi:hypothetical protein [Streptomyces jumonjinensis]|uniref:Scaffolding protein n=1 Tax=Streptomyces jumonjinensis TaxID=1945 RepID=A0A646KS76_STRJU|nr:hypothetical protein [Streptomyces jumonjinensis]MQT03866.1 hypothetical protein [Streptomyces jumonjinensis]
MSTPTPTPAPPAGSTPPEGGTGGTGPAGSPPPATPPVPPADSGDGTDWKAMARQWEKRAKENGTAAAELEKLKAANQTEQEKAIAAAEKNGRTAALSEAAPQIAQARLEAAAARAGVDLAPLAEFIDVTRFIGDDGTVDDKAIKAAVEKLGKLAPARGAGRSGADLGGGGGSGDQAHSLDKEIAQAKANGDWRTVMRLENSKLATAEAAQN